MDVTKAPLAHEPLDGAHVAVPPPVLEDRQQPSAHLGSRNQRARLVCGRRHGLIDDHVDVSIDGGGRMRGVQAVGRRDDEDVDARRAVEQILHVAREVHAGIRRRSPGALLRVVGDDGAEDEAWRGADQRGMEDGPAVTETDESDANVRGHGCRES